MIVKHYTTHNLYTQTAPFGFSANVFLNSTSGINSFGFSGSQNENHFEFQLRSGRIYDWNSNFISSYSLSQPITPINISGTVGTDSVDYHINGEPIAFGIPRQTGYIDAIYANSNDNMKLDLLINGGTPAYAFPSVLSFSTSASYVSFYFNNYSAFPINVFSGTFDGLKSQFSLSGQLTGTIPPTSSLNFYLRPSGAVTAGLNNLPFTFYTNFGTIHPVIGFSGVVDPFSGLNLSLVGPSIVHDAGIGQYAVRFTNSGVPISVIAYLQHLNGSGAQYSDVLLTGSYDVTGGSLITTSGNITANYLVSGSGFGGLMQQYLTDQIFGTASGFQWATGVQLQTISILGTGIGSGIGYTGLSTGMMNVLVSGDILDGSGCYYVTGEFTGTPLTSASIFPTGAIQATGAIYYNAPAVYDVLYLHDTHNAIINGYHYSTISDLTSYINNNTGTYYVRAGQAGGNIYLTGLLTGTQSNSILLQADSANQGTMTTSNSTLIGGLSFGIGTSTVPQSAFSGCLYGSGIYNNSLRVEGTGFYTQELTGLAFQTDLIFDYYKTFTGSWDLQTGFSLNTMIDFRDNGWVLNDQYTGAAINVQNGNFFVNVPFNLVGTGQDVVALFVSGLNTNHSVNQIISGVI